jgi:hypothetical protein
VFNLQYTSTESLLKAAAQYDATNADLSAFRAHGGKLILWHGMADPSIPSYGTVAYYQALVKQTGGNATQTTGSVVRTLPIFPYPQVPRYSGSGSVNDASNYYAVTSTDIQQYSFSWLGENLYGPASSQG